MEEINLSIIVPIYNAEKYIEDCIKSIIEKKNQNIEVILINDGSKDKTNEICEHYKNIDKRIVYLKNENKGCSVSRNLGIDLAKGKYITFIDSDDYYFSEEFLTNILDEMDKNQIEISIFGINRVFESKEEKIIPKKIKIKEEFYKQKDIFNSPCNKIYLSSLLKKNNIYFPIESHMGEDMAFNLKSFYFANKIKIIEKLYYNYRDNTNSVSYDLKKSFDIYNSFFDVVDFFSKKKIELENYNKVIYDYFKIHGVKKIYMTLIIMKLNNSNEEEIKKYIKIARNKIDEMEEKIRMTFFFQRIFYEFLLKVYFLKPIMKRIKKLILK